MIRQFHYHFYRSSLFSPPHLSDSSKENFFHSLSLYFKLFTLLLPHHFDVLHALSFNIFAHTHRHQADLHLIRTSHALSHYIKARSAYLSEMCVSHSQLVKLCYQHFITM